MEKRETKWVKLTNQTTGRFYLIKAELREQGYDSVCVCTPRQYDRAVKKLGPGFIVANANFVVGWSNDVDAPRLE